MSDWAGITRPILSGYLTVVTPGVQPPIKSVVLFKLKPP